jgi:hypothetical protein
MLWKIYFWIFTPLSLIALALTYQRSDYLSILVILAAITALHAIAFDDFTIPKQLWQIAFWIIIAVVILAWALSNLTITIEGLVINLPFLPVIYAVYRLAFKRKF